MRWEGPRKDGGREWWVRREAGCRETKVTTWKALRWTLSPDHRSAFIRGRAGREPATLTLHTTGCLVSYSPVRGGQTPFKVPQTLPRGSETFPTQQGPSLHPSLVATSFPSTTHKTSQKDHGWKPSGRGSPLIANIFPLPQIGWVLPPCPLFLPHLRTARRIC